MSNIEGWKQQLDWSWANDEGDLVDFDGLVFEVGASDSSHYVTIPFDVVRVLLRDLGYEICAKEDM